LHLEFFFFIIYIFFIFYIFQQPTEEDPDEGVKDLVEIILKKMVTHVFFIRTSNSMKPSGVLSFRFEGLKFS